MGSYFFWYKNFEIQTEAKVTGLCLSQDKFAIEW